MAINLGDAILFFKGDMRGIDDAGNRVKGVLGGMKEHSVAIGTAFTAMGGAITGALGLCVNSAMQFQKGMAEIASLGVKDLAGIEESIKSVATAYGLDLKDSINAAYQAISSGVPEDNLASFMEQAAKAATAGMTDLSTAIEHGSAMVNVFGGDVEQYFDQAFVAVKDGVLRFEDLNATMGRIAPTFKAAGLASQEMYASVAALTTQGVKAEEAVTGMKAVLTNIIKPTSDAEKAAEELGIEFSASALKAKGLQGFLDDVSKAAGGNVETMSKMFGSVEALNSVMALTGEGGAAKFDMVLKDMAGDGHACAEAFDLIVQNDPTRAFSILSAEVKVLSVEFGKALLPVLKDILDQVKPIIENTIAWAKENKELTAKIIEGAAAFGVASVALGTLFLAIKPVSAAFSILTSLTGPLIGTAGAAGTAAGGAGLLGLGTALAVVAAGAGTLYFILKDISAWREAQAAQEELADTTARLDRHTRDYMDSVGTAKEMSVDAAQTEARAWFEYYMGRTENEQEFAAMRTLLLNQNISAEEAALIVSKGLKNEELLAFSRANEEETQNLKEHYDIRVTDNADAAQKIVDAHIESATARQNAEASLLETLKGYWTGYWDFYKSMYSWIWDHALGGTVAGMWDWATGTGEQMATGGTTSKTTVLAGEEGPEMATLPNGVKAILPAMGLYNLPPGTYINTAAETAGMFAGAFAGGGTAPHSTTDGRLWLWNDSNNIEHWRLGPDWSIEEAASLRDTLGDMAAAALKAEKLSPGAFAQAKTMLETWIDPLRISAKYVKDGKIRGYESYHPIFGQAGRMHFERREDIHGGLMSESTQRGLFNIVMANIPGFAGGGMVGIDGGPVANFDIPEYTMPTPYVSTPNPTPDLSRFAPHGGGERREPGAGTTVTINATVRNDSDIETLARKIKSYIAQDNYRSARRRGSPVMA